MVQNPNLVFSTNISSGTITTWNQPKEPDMRTLELDVRIDVAINEKAAIASGIVEIDGEEFIAAASSKRMNGDRRNDEIGIKLAVARVLDRIQTKIERQAEGLIKHESDRQNGVF